MNLAQPGATRQPAEAIALEDAINAGTRDFDVVIAGEIPNNPNRSKMIGLAEMQSLFDHLRRRPVGRVLGDWLHVN